MNDRVWPRSLRISRLRLVRECPVVEIIRNPEDGSRIPSARRRRKKHERRQWPSKRSLTEAEVLTIGRSAALGHLVEIRRFRLTLVVTEPRLDARSGVSARTARGAKQTQRRQLVAMGSVYRSVPSRHRPNLRPQSLQAAVTNLGAGSHRPYSSPSNCRDERASASEARQLSPCRSLARASKKMSQSSASQRARSPRSFTSSSWPVSTVFTPRLRRYSSDSPSTSACT